MSKTKQSPSKKTAKKSATSSKEGQAAVTAYIASAPKETQKLLKEMRACLKKAAPGSSEALKWNTPAMSYDRILFTYAWAKKHVGLYSTPSSIKAHAKELSGYVTRTGSIQFPLDQKLPVTLIKKIAAYRVKELKEKDVRWM